MRERRKRERTKMKERKVNEQLVLGSCAVLE